MFLTITSIYSIIIKYYIATFYFPVLYDILFVSKMKEVHYERRNFTNRNYERLRGPI